MTTLTELGEYLIAVEPERSTIHSIGRRGTAMTKHRAIELADTLQAVKDAVKYMPHKLVGSPSELAAIREAIPLLRSISDKDAEIERLKADVKRWKDAASACETCGKYGLHECPQWLPVESLSRLEFLILDGAEFQLDGLPVEEWGDTLRCLIDRIDEGGLLYRTVPKTVTMDEWTSEQGAPIWRAPNDPPSERLMLTGRTAKLPIPDSGQDT